MHESHELLLAFISASGPISGGQSVVGLAGDGLRWSQVARDAPVGGDVEIWQAHASHPVSGPVTVRLHAGGYPATFAIAAFGASAYVAGHTSSHGHASAPAVNVSGLSGALIVAAGHGSGQKAAVAPLAGQQLLAKFFDGSAHSAGWVQQTQASSTSARIADVKPAAQWGMVAVAIASHTARSARISTVAKPSPTASTGHEAAIAAANPASGTNAAGAIADGGSMTPDSGNGKSGENVTHEYTYNARGDRTEESSEGTARRLSYDQANRLIGVGNAISYAYNGDGLRSSKTVNGATTEFVWSEAESLSELLQDGSTYYIYGPEGAPIEQLTGSTPTYLHQDQQGSTRLLTDGEGNVVGRYNYNAWGRVTSHTGSATTNLQYDGQYTDTETGFQYLRARYYDPATGQFLTVDPAFSATSSRYGYSEADPLNETDPTGMWSFNICIGRCLAYESGQGWGTGVGLGAGVQVGHVAVGGGGSVIKYERTGQVSISGGLKGIGGEVDVNHGHITVGQVCAGVGPVGLCGPPNWGESNSTYKPPSPLPLFKPCPGASGEPYQDLDYKGPDEP